MDCSTFFLSFSFKKYFCPQMFLSQYLLYSGAKCISSSPLGSSQLPTRESVCLKFLSGECLGLGLMLLFCSYFYDYSLTLFSRAQVFCSSLLCSLSHCNSYKQLQQFCTRNTFYLTILTLSWGYNRYSLSSNDEMKFSLMIGCSLIEWMWASLLWSMDYQPAISFLSQSMDQGRLVDGDLSMQRGLKQFYCESWDFRYQQGPGVSWWDGVMYTVLRWYFDVSILGNKLGEKERGKGKGFEFALFIMPDLITNNVFDSLVNHIHFSNPQPYNHLIQFSNKQSIYPINQPNKSDTHHR